MMFMIAILIPTMITMMILKGGFDSRRFHNDAVGLGDVDDYYYHSDHEKFDVSFMAMLQYLIMLMVIAMIIMMIVMCLTSGSFMMMPQNLILIMIIMMMRSNSIV